MPQMFLYSIIMILIGCVHVVTQGGKAEIDLLQAVGVPDETTVMYTAGWDGYPAFLIMPQANIRVAAQDLFQQPLFGEFVVSITIKPYTEKGGFVFAVVNPFQPIVQLGVQIQAYNSTHQNVALYLTPYSSNAQLSTVVASITVPSMVLKWTKLAFEVLQSRIVVYYDCQVYEEVGWQRLVENLEFEPGSSLYIGQAGPRFSTEPHYVGVLQELKISNGTRNAEGDKCDFEEKEQENSLKGSTDQGTDDCNFDYSGCDYGEVSLDPSSQATLTTLSPIAETSSNEKGELGPQGPLEVKGTEGSRLVISVVESDGNLWVRMFAFVNSRHQDNTRLSVLLSVQKVDVA